MLSYLCACKSNKYFLEKKLAQKDNFISKYENASLNLNAEQAANDIE